MGWTATASVGLTGIARFAVAKAAAVLVAVGGNRTVLMMWTMPLLAAMLAPVTLVSFTVITSMSDMANLTVAPLRVSTGPETISELGSAALRTCLAISIAPHIMTNATSVDTYANAMAQEVPSLIGRTGTASVFAAFVEIDITCSSLASLSGSALPDLVVLFADLVLAPLPDLPP